jgi:superoxide reductase
MSTFRHLTQTADWKTEKHVPVIEVSNKVKSIGVNITVGKEIPHPNTTEHHIVWVSLFFQPKGDKFPIELGKVEFSAHGASAAGPNTSTVYTQSSACFDFKTDKPGVLTAFAYCNVHGLWGNTLDVSI